MKVKIFHWIIVDKEIVEELFIERKLMKKSESEMTNFYINVRTFVDTILEIIIPRLSQ